MRHLFIVVDMSSAMSLQDLKPNRLKCTTSLLKSFASEFIDQNPISQMALIVTRNKRAEKISDLSANIKNHLEAIQRIEDMSCSGEPSLQNALELAMKTLRYVFYKWKHRKGTVRRCVKL